MATPLDPASWPDLHFRAMGCAMSVRLALARDTAHAPLRQSAALFATVESVLSRFDPTSELSRLNRRPRAWVAVSPILWSVVDAALAMAAETDGIFDPTLLPALEAAGYNRSFEQIATAACAPANAAVAPRALTGQVHSVERRSGRELRLPPGARLDLGGVAKGYTAALVVDSLRRWGPCLVDAGGDLAAGDAPPGWPGWPVGVAAPALIADTAQPAQREDLLLLWLANATVATSGVDYRHWMRDGRRQHHIIDPRTGQPAATDLRAATVLDRSAVRAEAWATAALVLGATDAARRWLDKGVAGALPDQNGGVRITPALQAAIAWRSPNLCERGCELATVKESLR